MRAIAPFFLPVKTTSARSVSTTVVKTDYTFVARAVSPGGNTYGPATLIYHGLPISLAGNIGVIWLTELDKISGTETNNSSNAFWGGSMENTPSSYDIEEASQPQYRGRELLERLRQKYKLSGRVLPHNEVITSGEVVSVFTTGDSNLHSKIRNIIPELKEKFPCFHGNCWTGSYSKEQEEVLKIVKEATSSTNIKLQSIDTAFKLHSLRESVIRKHSIDPELLHYCTSSGSLTRQNGSAALPSDFRREVKKNTEKTTSSSTPYVQKNNSGEQLDISMENFIRTLEPWQACRPHLHEELYKEHIRKGPEGTRWSCNVSSSRKSNCSTHIFERR